MSSIKSDGVQTTGTGSYPSLGGGYEPLIFSTKASSETCQLATGQAQPSKSPS